MEQSAYIEHLEQEEKHWWFIARRAICNSLLKKLNIPGNACILEAGCGSGGNLPMLSGFGQVFAFEINSLMLNHAKARKIGNVEYSKLPNEIPFPEKKFDLIAMFDVLEHIEDDRNALFHLAKRLNEGGMVFLTVPAFSWLFSQHDRLHHHFRRYGKEELETKLKEAGFEICVLTYWNFFIFPIAAIVRAMCYFSNSERSAGTKTPPAWLNFAMAKIVSFEKFLIPFAPLPFGLSLIAVAKKRKEQ